MNENSIISLQIHSYTFIASFTNRILRITLELNHHDQVIYISPKYSHQYFPQELQIIFLNVEGFYQYLYKLAMKNMAQRIIFRNEILIIKVFIDDKIRQIPIRMRKMKQIHYDSMSTISKSKQRQNQRHSYSHQYMLTSIAQEGEQQQEINSLASKLSKMNYPAPRLKIMMLKQSNKLKKGFKNNDLQSLSASKAVKQYPYMKPQTIHRYQKFNTQSVINQSRNSRSNSIQQNKTIFNKNRSRILSLKKNVRQNSLDLSTKDLNIANIKQIVSIQWQKLIMLNLGYNNMGTQGFKLLTSIRWPSLKTLYACFNNIYIIQWIPANICFLKTLSLSGNKIKQIPKNIIQLQFLQQLFIYNNKIQILPQQLIMMQQLKNFSIYGNKLDLFKNKKIMAKLKLKKVQVWD